MYEWAIAITELQDLDIKIAKLQEQIKNIPVKKLECQQLYATEAQTFETSRQAVQSLELKARNLENQSTQILEKKRNFQAKSTMIRNNEEYKAALLQIELCDKAIAEVEEQQLAVMMEIDSAKKSLAEQKTSLEHAKKRSQNAMDDLVGLQAKCEAQLEKLGAMRPNLEKPVLPEILTIYNRLRSSVKQSKTQPCIVPLIAESCGRCHMKVTAQLCQDVINGKVVICPSCGAVIYQED